MSSPGELQQPNPKQQTELSSPGSSPPGVANGGAAGTSAERVLRQHRSQGSKVGSASPSLENRLFSKRAREIQAEEGVALPAWTPQSGSTREVSFETGSISEPREKKSNSLGSPSHEVGEDMSPGFRRARAGTLPSRLSTNSGHSTPLASISSTVTPYRATRLRDEQSSDSLSNRLRSGSLGLPNRQVYSNAFGPSIFASSWSNRVTGIPSSPAVASSQLGRDDEQTPVRTLDYLGLEDTPPPPPNSIPRDTRSSNANNNAKYEETRAAMQPFAAELSELPRDANRIRSYSVNAKENYDDEFYEDYDKHGSGSLGLNEVMRNMSPARPRAQTTANATESPPGISGRFAKGSANADRSAYYEDVGNRSVAGETGIGTPQEDSTIGPTRALWLGNIPASTTSSSLIAIFGAYGSIESARVLTHKNCGFVNFEVIDAAIQARALLHGKEIFPGAGPVRIGFAKVPTAPSSFLNASPEPFVPEESSFQYTGLKAVEMKDEILHIAVELGASPEEVKEIESLVDEAVAFKDYAAEIPNLPEPTPNRLHDAPKLRELRKRIDNGSCSGEEIERIAVEMLDEIAELSSDYLGNTVVQKLFEYCSEETKDLMLERIAPYMAQIGIHKNGTWAAQKIIEVARTETQMSLIVRNLLPYAHLLFLDQFGNYVLQCCLRFERPWNDFIFRTMLARLNELAQGRFGSRAMRACLESHHTTKEQQRLLAASIAIHSVHLATNGNGALLLTWYLDTCTFPNRHRILAPLLVPHIVPLCIHKLASLTVLKTVNQRLEAEAREEIVKALFFSPNDKALTDVLADSQNGPNVVFKMLTTPFIDGDLRQQIVSNVRKVLVRSNASGSPGYKRLLDEVGLSMRNGLSGSPQSETMPRPSQPSPAHREYPSVYSVPPQAGFDRGSPVDGATLQSLEQLNIGAPFGNNTQSFAAAQQNLQYQALLQQQIRAAAAASGAPQNYYGMQANLAAFASEQYRNTTGGVASPVLNANFNPLLAQQLIQAGYPYASGLVYPPQQRQGGRRR